jgi:chromosome segregation ATPase
MSKKSLFEDNLARNHKFVIKKSNAVYQKRVTAPPKKYQKSNTTSLNESVSRVMSAQRLKNNELQNKLNELRMENEKILEENRTLKRMHKREEIAVKRLENQDNDITRLIKNHLEETGSLREQLKKAKNENKKFYNSLIEKDEEIRSLKKKCDEMRKIMNDKKLMDSVELSKRLDELEKDLQNYKTKCEVNTFLKSNILFFLVINFDLKSKF